MRTLPIKAVELSGIDNRTFLLGKELLIRLPSAQGYAAQVAKEQIWLPKLAEYLPIQIPQPVAMGYPNQHYPWHWSIYKWIPGTSVNQLKLDDHTLETLAKDLASFIKALHLVPTTDAPVGGLHNYYRGCHLSVYDQDAKSNIQILNKIIDPTKALAVWNKAVSSQWEVDPVWVHGDVASGNILIYDNKLTAMIDFGCMCIGDPACDLVIAWTLFDGSSREIFKKHMNLDPHTWSRARGWALWKAYFELISCQDQTSKKAFNKLKIIKDVLEEYKNEKI